MVGRVAHINSGPCASFSSLVMRYTLSILGGSFRYAKRWNSSLQSDELGPLKSTFCGEAGARSLAPRGVV